MTKSACPPLPDPADALGADAAPSQSEFRLVLFALLLATALGAFERSIVSAAMPQIGAELGGIENLSWTISTFMIAQGVSIPIYGKLGDEMGKKKLLSIAILIFIAGSLLSGISNSMEMLILSRGLQGIGAGGLATLPTAAIGHFIGPLERARYQGLFVTVFGLCSILGPAVGGFLTTLYGWRSVFLVNLPLGLLVLELIRRHYRSHEPLSPRQPFDYAGTLILGVTTVLLMLLLTWGGTRHPWSAPIMLWLAAATAALATTFCVWQRVATAPIFPMTMLRAKGFYQALLISCAIGAGFYGTSVYLPLYFQVAMGQPASVAGALIVPLVLGNIAGATLTGRLIARTAHARLPLMVGCGIVSAGFFLMSRIDPGQSLIVPFEICLAITGFGGGLCMPTLVIVVQSRIPAEQLGIATAAMTFMNTLAGAAGVALAGSMLNARLDALLPAGSHALVVIEGAALEISPAIATAYAQAFNGLFLTSALLCGLACLLSWATPSRLDDRAPRLTPSA
ncbi:MFS transporter [Novosphingobium sp. BL-52-GroH]|uniref:MFS transporter n=1 Tax=Novosphingobium sp. BL-52-GroH TaxID=3349877 RepID=UPI0038503CA0